MVTLDDYLASNGWAVESFGRRESGCSVDVVRRGEDLVVVKYAEDERAVGWLENALVLHRAVRHPAIPTVLGAIRTAAGLGLIEEFAQGCVLADPQNPAIPPREQPDSPYARFLALSVQELTAAVAQLIDAHVSVAEAGFVAVDLHDGCLIYDFDTRTLRLVDLDHYRPGPYVLQDDR